MHVRTAKLAKFGVPTSLQLFLHYHLKIRSKLKVAIIDATNKCNLSCSICYYKRNWNTEELSLEKWDVVLSDLKNKGVEVVTWTGGEPLLRKELIEKGRELFTFNTVFTNGTQAIPDWPDVVFYVSVDGQKAEYERLRGRHHAEVKNTIENSPQPVIIAMTINNFNEGCLEGFVEEWLSVPKVKGITFSLYSRNENRRDVFGMDEEKTREVVDRLLMIKEKCGEKIVLSRKVIKSFLPENRSKAIGENCIVKNFYCLDSNGKPKYPCSMMGSDCETCGQFVPYCFSSIFREFDVEMVNSAKKFWFRL